jgi:hypothetical protein
VPVELVNDSGLTISALLKVIATSLHVMARVKVKVIGLSSGLKPVSYILLHVSHVLLTPSSTSSVLPSCALELHAITNTMQRQQTICANMAERGCTQCEAHRGRSDAHEHQRRSDSGIDFSND